MKKKERRNSVCATDETSAVEMLSTASRHPQEHDYVQQSHEDLLVGLTGRRSGARDSGT